VCVCVCVLPGLWSPGCSSSVSPALRSSWWPEPAGNPEHPSHRSPCAHTHTHRSEVTGYRSEAPPPDSPLDDLSDLRLPVSLALLLVLQPARLSREAVHEDPELGGQESWDRTARGPSRDLKGPPGPQGPAAGLQDHLTLSPSAISLMFSSLRSFFSRSDFSFRAETASSISACLQEGRTPGSGPPCPSSGPGSGPPPPGQRTHLSLLALSSLSRSCSSSLLAASCAPSDSCRSLRRSLVSEE